MIISCFLERNTQFTIFAICECMLKGICDKLVNDKAERNTSVYVQINILDINIQLDLICLNFIIMEECSR